jgi:hypothetical protein
MSPRAFARGLIVWSALNGMPSATDELVEVFSAELTVTGLIFGYPITVLKDPAVDDSPDSSGKVTLTVPPHVGEFTRSTVAMFAAISRPPL